MFSGSPQIDTIDSDALGFVLQLVSEKELHKIWLCSPESKQLPVDRSDSPELFAGRDQEVNVTLRPR